MVSYHSQHKLGSLGCMWSSYFLLVEIDLFIDVKLYIKSKLFCFFFLVGTPAMFFLLCPHCGVSKANVSRIEVQSV